MLDHSEKFIREFANPAIPTMVKAGFAQRYVRWMDAHASGAMEIAAHMKIIAPLTSTGPSVPARVVYDSGSMLTIRFPHVVFAGALVQIRIQSKVVFGLARRCTAIGSEYEIEVKKEEIY
jgi:hypothetical protein